MTGCLVMAALLHGWYTWSWPIIDPDLGKVVAQQAEPTPTVDPLAIPELPENPTQAEFGRVSFYYNCMPCHGDHGQGLTDEWRQTWVDDHQNCWARGCHGGRIEDQGFPLPVSIPPVIGSPALSHRFSSPESLHDYLKLTHPPQLPGTLPEEDYWALTAFLLVENGQLPPDAELGLAATTVTGFNPRWYLLLVLGVAIGIVLIWTLRLRTVPHQQRQGRDAA